MSHRFLQSNLARSLAGFAIVMVFIVMVFAGAAFAAGPTEKILYRFHGNDGAYPSGALLLDPAGNIFGTTPSGGPNADGVVFQLTPSKHGVWTQSLLRVLVGAGADGPDGGLVSDQAGNLYGTTLGGGPFVGGSVFELSPPQVQGGQWIFTVLHNFEWGTDGARLYGGLVFDQAGNLYGTTALGGGSRNCDKMGFNGCGTVFQLLRPAQPGGAWTENVLYRFQGGADGAIPVAGLTIDSHGNVYGTASEGGAFGGGTVFELTPSGSAWTETTLHSFGGPDGAYPYADLILDSAGNLYGTTTGGGPYTSCGVVFQMQPPAQQGNPWTENVLWNPSHPHRSQGCSPYAGVVLDANGNLYGTTEFGGHFETCDCGVVFELMPPAQPGGAWTEVVLHRFSKGNDGGYPTGDLILDQTGTLYGTTSFGGPSGEGTVFRIVP